MNRESIITKAIELIKLRTRRDNLTLMILLGEQYNEHLSAEDILAILPQEIQQEIYDTDDH